jgi:hypothetical protein
MSHDLEGVEATAVGGRAPAGGRAAASEVPRGSAAALPAATSRALSQRRAEAMRALFPKLSAWRASGAYLAELTAAFDELAQAQDLADLERRFGQVEQRRAISG